jgi:hypothetical protein
MKLLSPEFQKSSRPFNEEERKMTRKFKIRQFILVVAFAVAATANATTPQVVIQQNKSFGVWNSTISGVVSGVTPSSYVLMAFIYIPGLGWYSKPTDAQPYITLSGAGTFSAYLNTGGIDDYSTMVELYLLPANSPLITTAVNGAVEVPPAIKAAAVASDRSICPGQPTLNWSGLTWFVKESNGAQVGPGVNGANIFSSSSNNAWVDVYGNLHLQIVKNPNGQWACAELVSPYRLGYGTYSFDCFTQVDNLDPAATLGMFTWSDFTSDYANREIDIEASRWDVANNSWNLQYVIQPYTITGNINRFFDSSGISSAQTIYWQPTRVGFTSSENPLFPINSWTYNGASIPASGDERAHINLWLNNSGFNGSIPGPVKGQAVQVTLSNFKFTPWADPVHPVYVWGVNASNDATAKLNYTKYQFQFSGKVVAKDTNGFTLEIQAYGSLGPSMIQVLDPGETYNLGQTITAQGLATPQWTLDTSNGRIIPQ